MNEWFVFGASCVCLAVGLGLCLVPIRRYLVPAKIGLAGALFLLCGVILMTTFKWTEIAIKISGLEVKLAEAKQENIESRQALASVQNAFSPASKEQSLRAVLASYKKATNSEPTPAQLAGFKEALAGADVTIVPATALDKIILHDRPGEPKK